VLAEGPEVVEPSRERATVASVAATVTAFFFMPYDFLRKTRMTFSTAMNGICLTDKLCVFSHLVRSQRDCSFSDSGTCSLFSFYSPVSMLRIARSSRSFSTQSSAATFLCSLRRFNARPRKNDRDEMPDFGPGCRKQRSSGHECSYAGTGKPQAKIGASSVRLKARVSGCAWISGVRTVPISANGKCGFQ